MAHLHRVTTVAKRLPKANTRY